MAGVRHKIIRASYELFAGQEFDKIAVMDIVKKAGVSKASFYNHFSDKYELLYMYCADAINNKALRRYDGTNWDQIQAGIFQLGYDHRELFRSLQRSSGAADFWYSVSRLMFKVLSRIRLLNSGREELPDDETLTLEMYVNSLIFLFRKMVLSECPLSCAEISDVAVRTLPDGFKMLPYDLAKRISA